MKAETIEIRAGSVREAVDLALRIPEFTDPYGLASHASPTLPELDHVLIAEAAGEPVGFRAGKRFSSDTFAVWLAGVLPSYRRRGIASALYLHQKEWLRAQGYVFLRTHVRNSNRVMLRVLIDNGYDVVGVIEDGDLARHKVVFVKRL